MKGWKKLAVSASKTGLLMRGRLPAEMQVRLSAPAAAPWILDVDVFACFFREGRSSNQCPSRSSLTACSGG